jgi:hypothetical protein
MPELLGWGARPGLLPEVEGEARRLSFNPTFLPNFSLIVAARRVASDVLRLIAAAHHMINRARVFNFQF